MNKLDLLNKKKRSVLLTSALVVILLTMVFLPIQQSSAAPITNVPTGVNGRVLSAGMAGDTSNWIEIARNGDYSLIVRKDVLPIGTVNFPNSGTNPNYAVSNARNVVNNWFKNTLNSNARLRDFTVKNDALSQLGAFASTGSGFSKPSTTAMRTGDDVAFLLSFAEAASFCSRQYGTSSSTWATSSSIAQSNYGKLSQIATSPSQKDFWWLRSPGNNAASASSVGTHNPAMYSCVWASSVSTYGSYVYLRPALWVNSNIFETSPPKFTVTVVDSYAAVTGAGSYTPGSSVTVDAGSRLGYTFAGWTVSGISSLSNSAVASFTMPSNNVVVTANWQIEQYSITYVLNGGNLATGYPTTYNVENSATINTNTVGTPTFTGYRFVNWQVIYGNGTMFALTSTGIPAGSTGDITLRAVWDPTPILYNINYVLNDGINAPGNPTSYTVAGVFPVHISNPSRSGYDFLGWTVIYSNGTLIAMTPSYSIPVGSYGDVTLLASWVPAARSYNINYVLNGGTISNAPSTYSTTGLPLSIPNPSMTGYVFSHWQMTCANGSMVVLQNGVIPAGTTGDVTLNAVWSVIETYSITYLLSGGVNAVNNPTTYTVQSDFPIRIDAPSMPGYTFLYWVAIYANGSADVLPSSGIAAGTEGDIILVAVWYP